MPLLFSYSFILLANPLVFFFFFFNDTATTEIYTLSLHDALPISRRPGDDRTNDRTPERSIAAPQGQNGRCLLLDRKSTRLNSSHGYISYAVFCLKKKKNKLIHSSSITYSHGSITVCGIKLRTV